MKMAKRDLGVVTCQVMLEASKCIEEGVCVVVYQRGGGSGVMVCYVSLRRKNSFLHSSLCREWQLAE